MMRLQGIICMMFLVVLGGCAATKQAREVEQSGFLGDIYPLLHEGKEGEALLVYKPEHIDHARAATYTKILLDPVTIWRGKESKEKGMSQEQIQTLADHFYSLLYLNFKEDYEMVQKPGPQYVSYSSGYYQSRGIDGGVGRGFQHCSPSACPLNH